MRKERESNGKWVQANLCHFTPARTFGFVSLSGFLCFFFFISVFSFFFLSFFLSNVQWGSMLMVFQVFELKFLCTRSDFSRLPYLDLCFHKVIFFGYQWRLDFLDQSTHTYIKETRKCRCVFFQVTTFAPLLAIWTFGVECCDP